ncbi:MAG: hypothetical protein ABI609_12005 [Acidobacteriota bacterium]
MPRRKKAPKNTALLTLSEVSRRSNISMPTLLRYKREYQRRLPSVGTGRTQRYPESALAVVAEIKSENMKHRRRRKGSKAPGAVPRSLLSLNEIGRLTNISYPTLLRYVATYLPELPHEGEGRRRRFLPSAVAVFQRLRAESRRGRKPSAAPTPRASNDAAILRWLEQIGNTQLEIVKQLRNLARRADRPIRVQVKR